MGAHWENKTRDFRSLAFSVTLHVEKCRKYRYMFYHLTEQMAWTTPISLNYLFFYFFLFNNIYLVTTLLMTILTFTWRKNKNKVQEIKEKYDVTAFATN